MRLCSSIWVCRVWAVGLVLLGVAASARAGLVIDRTADASAPPAGVVVQPPLTPAESKTDPKPDPAVSLQPIAPAVTPEPEAVPAKPAPPVPDSLVGQENASAVPPSGSPAGDSQVQSVRLEKTNNSVPEPSSLLALGVLCPLLLRRRRTR